MRRTRIVCTLGPASTSTPVVRGMVAAGIDVARFNFSHGDAESHRRAVIAVRAMAEAAGRHIALMQDLQGPKIRTGSLAQAPVRLIRGARVTLTSRAVVGDERLVPVSHSELLQALKARDRILLADGQIELRVLAVERTEAFCSIVRGGLLGERKGIIAPGVALELPALTDKDLTDIRAGAELGFDYVAMSFVRGPEDLLACRSALEGCGRPTRVIAKLEQAAALRNLRGILDVADAVMVARGDLGAELGPSDVPSAQKDIIQRANIAGVPVITATEMLESMVGSTRPTRAEASDVANAIWDGTDAVMLSQETSVGAHAVASVRAMAHLCRAAERHPAYARTRPRPPADRNISQAIANGAAAVATEIRARAIIAFTESGATARRVSQARPRVPIVAASPHQEVLRRTALYCGVVPMRVEPGPDTDTIIARTTGAARANGLVRTGDRVVVVAGVPLGLGRPGRPNLVKVEVVS
ncbi:MAG: pyruvate kinase [Chloroflexota bacterium]|nr:pyruvate kinase [Chloroflexota bacterium]